ncbi:MULTISPECIES: hypothetical protein [unclassified Herbaspirillum]|uniref:hypothetical protein n=1 Tax=unclassified Herbaspirillum TaxID=2624150 RepID=UPI001154E5E4|nr:MULTISPECIES: hypothetical protein [unclassified Herbaspirillum]MBB5393432.1 hypothetical protein [Herbaspirillum sp. SJZ102]TQK03820.1 hypothetical protein FB599_3386 [Herbaspirillum sp. SJZ130]TQK08552.1 hypothetical protein FB598_3325 [Herbaspirillum sp. SJZ106]
MATRVQAATTARKKTVAKAAPAARPTVKKPAAKPAARPAAKASPKTAPKAAAPAPKAPAATPKAAAPAPKKPAVAVPAKPLQKPAALTKAEKKAAKPKKVKQVRDSFTMPENEYAVLAQVKKSCLKAGVEIKKSDLLRIGVSLIKNLKIADLKDILSSLTPLKVGRPKK